MPPADPTTVGLLTAAALVGIGLFAVRYVIDGYLAVHHVIRWLIRRVIERRR